MSMGKKKLLFKVDAVSSSLDELDAKLEPLFSQSLPETAALLDNLQQAKLHVVISYLINDLIYIYLRTKGLDPKTHPVVAELDRVRKYFAKIQDAEDIGKQKPPETPTGIDKAAAGRFIKHAISQVRQNAAAESGARYSQPSTSMFVPVQMTDKMRERDQYQQDLAVESDSEDAVLEVIGDDEKEQPGNQRKGKEHSQSVEMQELTDSVGTKAEYQREKRPRPMDPFTSLVDKTGSDADTGVGQPKNKSKKLEAVIDVDSTSRRAGSDTEIGNAETALKKQRKETKVTT